MSATHSAIHLTISGESFHARLQSDLAPRSCGRLMQLLPYRGELIHAQWSGQACWAPLGSSWPTGEILAPESAIAYPAPGEVLLFGGDLSEPELLIAYGPTRFASMAGPLAGNPVLKIEDGLARLAELGRQILRRGAVDLRIDSAAAR
jgi:hypothetical protein